VLLDGSALPVLCVSLGRSVGLWLDWRSVVVSLSLLLGVWTFMWFVCFCFLTDSWRRTNNVAALKHKSASEAAIAFSFFSLAVFVRCTHCSVTYTSLCLIGLSVISCLSHSHMPYAALPYMYVGLGLSAIRQHESVYDVDEGLMSYSRC